MPVQFKESPSSSSVALRNVLVRHWREETAQLSENIHKIIDTKAFAGCLGEWLSEQLNRNEAQAKKQQQQQQALGTSHSSATVQELEGIRKMFLVFNQHLCLNEVGGGEGDSVLEHHRKDMKIMLSECKAALRYANQVEASRIFKRFRLLLHTLEKIRRDLPEDGEATEGATVGSDGKTECVERQVDGDTSGGRGKGVILPKVPEEQKPVSPEFFCSFGISMAAQSRIFYRKQVQHADVRNALCSESMAPQLSTWLRNCPGDSKRPNRIFRPPVIRGKCDEAATRAEDTSGGVGGYESMQLNITAILEQLTNIHSETVRA